MPQPKGLSRRCCRARRAVNAAFEDCTVLTQCLERHPDRGGALVEYERLRKEHTDAPQRKCQYELPGAGWGLREVEHRVRDQQLRNDAAGQRNHQRPCQP